MLAATSAAVHCCWVKACMNSCIDAFAVTQACCQPVLQSSTERWGAQHPVDFAYTSAALQPKLNTALSVTELQSHQ